MADLQIDQAFEQDDLVLEPGEVVRVVEVITIVEQVLHVRREVLLRVLQEIAPVFSVGSRD